MASDAERRLLARGCPIVEFSSPEQDEEESDVIGYVVMRPDGVGARVHAWVRPGVRPDQRARYAEWLEVRIGRFFEHGPEPDGWLRRPSDGDWQLRAREVVLPSLDG